MGNNKVRFIYCSLHDRVFNYSRGAGAHFKVKHLMSNINKALASGVAVDLGEVSFQIIDGSVKYEFKELNRAEDKLRGLADRGFKQSELNSRISRIYKRKKRWKG